MEHPPPDVHIHAQRVVHDDPLALVELLDLSAPIKVRAESLDAFQLTTRQRTRETVLSTKTRTVSLTTTALFLVHTRLHTYLCAEDASIKGRMLTLLQLTPQQRDQGGEALLRYVEMVRSVDTTDPDISAPSTASLGAPETSAAAPNLDEDDEDGQDTGQVEGRGEDGPHASVTVEGQEQGDTDQKSAAPSTGKTRPAPGVRASATPLTADELDPPRLPRPAQAAR